MLAISTPCVGTRNGQTFLSLKGGEVADYELKLEIKNGITADSGMAIPSSAPGRIVVEARWRCLAKSIDRKASSGISAVTV